MRLQGKRVIITGAGSGMGEAGARLFAAEGAKVVVVDRDEAALAALVERIAAAGGHAHAVVADLAYAEEAVRMVREGDQMLGGLDVLWSHAGINGPTETESLNLEQVQTVFAVNVLAGIVACAEALPLMRKAGGGSIVLTASIAGLVGSIQSPIYSATKFAIVGFAKSLALRAAVDRVRVNALCPGPVDTQTLRELTAPTGAGGKGPEIGRQLLASIPLARLGKPAELAEAALWLASDASAFVTGIALPVDGGLTAR